MIATKTMSFRMVLLTRVGQPRVEAHRNQAGARGLRRPVMASGHAAIPWEPRKAAASNPMTAALRFSPFHSVTQIALATGTTHADPSGAWLLEASFSFNLRRSVRAFRA